MKIKLIFLSIFLTINIHTQLNAAAAATKSIQSAHEKQWAIYIKTQAQKPEVVAALLAKAQIDDLTPFEKDILKAYQDILTTAQPIA